MSFVVLCRQDVKSFASIARNSVTVGLVDKWEALEGKKDNLNNLANEMTIDQSSKPSKLWILSIIKPRIGFTDFRILYFPFCLQDLSTLMAPQDKLWLKAEPSKFQFKH